LGAGHRDPSSPCPGSPAPVQLKLPGSLLESTGGSILASAEEFRLGSITKQFTAVLVLQLVEQGKLKLEGKISDYLPEYPRSRASASPFASC
jgi:hypothetical protein